MKGKAVRKQCAAAKKIQVDYSFFNYFYIKQSNVNILNI